MALFSAPTIAAPHGSELTTVEIFGVPETIGKTGDNGYCSDENNVIKIDPTGGTNCSVAGA